MTVPFTRSLPYVLSAQLNDDKGAARLMVAQVAAVPDPNHVTIDVQGYQLVVPRISSYSPIVGEAVIIILGKSTLVAIGAVGGTAGGTGNQGPMGPQGPVGPPGPAWPEYHENNLPASAANGTMALLRWAAGLGYGSTRWTLRYDDPATLAGYPWVFCGGAPLVGESSGANPTINEDVGLNPSIMVPRDGVYAVSASCEVYSTKGDAGINYTSGGTPTFNLSVGASAAASEYAAVCWCTSYQQIFSFAGHIIGASKGERISLFCQDVVKNGSTLSAMRRNMTVTPLALA